MAISFTDVVGRATILLPNAQGETRPHEWPAAVEFFRGRLIDILQSSKVTLEKRVELGRWLVAASTQMTPGQFDAFMREIDMKKCNGHTLRKFKACAKSQFVDEETGEVLKDSLRAWLEAKGLDPRLADEFRGLEIAVGYRTPAKSDRLVVAPKPVDPDDPDDYVLNDGELDGMAALNFDHDDEGDEPGTADETDNTSNPAHRGGGGDGVADADRLGDRRAGDTHPPAVTGEAGVSSFPSAADDRIGGGRTRAPDAGGLQLSLADLYEARDRVRAALDVADLGTLTDQQRELLLELAASLTGDETQTEASLR